MSANKNVNFTSTPARTKPRVAQKLAQAKGVLSESVVRYGLEMSREEVSVAQGNAVDHPDGRAAVGVVDVDVEVDDTVVVGVWVGGGGVEVTAAVVQETSAKLGLAATPTGLNTAPVSCSMTTVRYWDAKCLSSARD